MYSSGWRAWATIFAFPKIVHSLHCVERRLVSHDLGWSGYDVPHKPMSEVTCRRIGIIYYEHETLGLFGYFVDCQRRTHVLAFTSEAFWDVSPVAEIRAAKFHSVLRWNFRSARAGDQSQCKQQDWKPSFHRTSYPTIARFFSAAIRQTPRDPLGVTLIIGAWNEPFMLTFGPLTAASLPEP